jgi:hypothetical protein
MTYEPGDFTFVITQDVREMLTDAYQAVTKTESWPMIGQEPGMGGYMFSDAEHIVKIRSELKYKNHNGPSYGWTLRQMQSIANHGWENYVNRVKEGQADASTTLG